MAGIPCCPVCSVLCSSNIRVGAQAKMINPYYAICGATFLAFIPVPIRVALLVRASGGLFK
jgi:hypothetical protein